VDDRALLSELRQRPQCKQAHRPGDPLLEGKPSASDLLQGLLHPDPEQRPSMAKALKHPFFRPDKVAVKEKQLQEEKQKLQENKKGFDRIERKLSLLDKKLSEIGMGVADLRQQLKKYHGVTTKMLAKIPNSRSVSSNQRYAKKMDPQNLLLLLCLHSMRRKGRSA